MRLVCCLPVHAGNLNLATRSFAPPALHFTRLCHYIIVNLTNAIHLPVPLTR